jgi:radical SAM superfamily enzyme YgiQ (UPF0313 family)
MSSDEGSLTDQGSHCPHPQGSQARVLLTSVFGPYALDDAYGSRAVNPMELYHNQVTRLQGPFSLRVFHRSWGLMLIQCNIQARCTLLDFPDLERFTQEIRDGDYDIVGISSILSNILKVKKMCELVRRHLPKATIVIGGHLASLSDLQTRIDADHIVTGDGVRWFRRFLGEDEDQPVKHPLVLTPIGMRTAGVAVPQRTGEVAATLIPSVGCPLGCNFCCTSSMFGGKGRFINFYETGDEIFDIMCQIEEGIKTRSFFIMDENFLLHRKRALRLLDLMEAHDKAWSLYVFSSANVISSYSLDQIVRLGISWVWMGIEGEDCQYAKLQGVDTFRLVRKLQSHGICVLGSTIIGLENHVPENIDQVIDYAVRHDTDFHQFMLYMPLPETPLYSEMLAQGRMKTETECPFADCHAQYAFNYRHPYIRDGQEREFLLRAFRRDIRANGPSLVRVARTTLKGWKRHRNHPDPRVRRRVAWETAWLPTAFSALASAARLYYRKDPEIHARISATLDDLHREFGWRSRLVGSLGGYWLLGRLRREERRLAAGWTYEPPTFYERNYPPEQDADTPQGQANLCQFVTPRTHTSLSPRGCGGFNLATR